MKCGRTGTLAGASLALVLPAACAAPTSVEAPVGTAEPQGLEPNSGIDKDALAAVMAMGTQIGVFHYPDLADPAQLAAAPARLCASRGLALDSFKDESLEHPESLPGTRHLVIYCR